MAAVHIFGDKDITLCGTKSKKNDLIVTSDAVLVTCKRCLHRLTVPVETDPDEDGYLV